MLHKAQAYGKMREREKETEREREKKGGREGEKATSESCKVPNM
jgi:hypothetical protein